MIIKRFIDLPIVAAILLALLTIEVHAEYNCKQEVIHKSEAIHRYGENLQSFFYLEPRKFTFFERYNNIPGTDFLLLMLGAINVDTRRENFRVIDSGNNDLIILQTNIFFPTKDQERNYLPKIYLDDNQKYSVTSCQFDSKTKIKFHAVDIEKKRIIKVGKMSGEAYDLSSPLCDRISDEEIHYFKKSYCTNLLTLEYVYNELGFDKAKYFVPRKIMKDPRTVSPRGYLYLSLLSENKNDLEDIYNQLLVQGKKNSDLKSEIKFSAIQGRDGAFQLLMGFRTSVDRIVHDRTLDLISYLLRMKLPDSVSVDLFHLDRDRKRRFPPIQRDKLGKNLYSDIIIRPEQRVKARNFVNILTGKKLEHLRCLDKNKTCYKTLKENCPMITEIDSEKSLQIIYTKTKKYQRPARPIRIDLSFNDSCLKDLRFISINETGRHTIQYFDKKTIEEFNRELVSNIGFTTLNTSFYSIDKSPGFNDILKQIQKTPQFFVSENTQDKLTPAVVFELGNFPSYNKEAVMRVIKRIEAYYETKKKLTDY